jgi:hypothetical protein
MARPPATVVRALARLLGLPTLLIAAAPRAAQACAVCFGQSDSPMALSVNMGIYVLLGVTAGVLAAFGAFFVHLMRQARMAADAAPAGADLHVQPQGGAAQC